MQHIFKCSVDGAEEETVYSDAEINWPIYIINVKMTPYI